MSEEELQALREANALAGQALASNDLTKVIEILNEINALLEKIRP